MNKIKHLYTEGGKTLSGEEYNIYPRPQLKRDSFLSLNGKWTLVLNGGQRLPITVPYPPESLLSGVFKDMGKDPSYAYTRSFTLPNGFKKDRVIINFGAVDQICKVYVNDCYVGKNVGGYNHFSFDITNYLLEGANTLTVRVWDKLSEKDLPYGKQRYKRGGMWYTPISGIWQSVWLESVPDEYVKALYIKTTANHAKIYFMGVDTGTLILNTESGDREYAVEHGICEITMPSPRLWSPSDPYLYTFTARFGQDEISSYLAFRTLEVKKVGGFQRLCLNGKPFFFHGILDQGYFSDGIFTPASPEEYRNDILRMKELGFNTLRKHVKVEPDIFYYECDRLGMIVFQDFVNNGAYSFLRDTAVPTVLSKKFPEALMRRTKRQRDGFTDGVRKTLRQLYSHPCICYWTIFNEGWGQFDSDKMYDFVEETDRSRFIDSTSGWFKKKKSDVESLHVYFKPVKLEFSDKPIILSEFGGYSYKVEGHSANEKQTYGYKLFNNKKEFQAGLVKLYTEQIIPAIKQGLCGAIYTQLSDVEDETNGLYTYDRQVCKVDRQVMLKIAEKLKI